MEYIDGNILKEVRELIRESCDFNGKPAKDFQNFHKAFLKFSLGVLDLTIDYENKSISTLNSKPLTANSLEMGKFGDALRETVSYVDLEETLLGCVVEGGLNKRFYRQLLSEFGRSSENGMKTA